jgi:hypothetical protein
MTRVEWLDSKNLILFRLVKYKIKLSALPKWNNQKNLNCSDSGGPSEMAFRAAKKKPGAIRPIRGFAKQKSPQLTSPFLCNFLLDYQKKVEKNAQQQALLRAKKQ